jgi:hypothetical protein
VAGEEKEFLKRCAKEKAASPGFSAVALARLGNIAHIHKGGMAVAFSASEATVNSCRTASPNRCKNASITSQHSRATRRRF